MRHHSKAVFLFEVAMNQLTFRGVAGMHPRFTVLCVCVGFLFVSSGRILRILCVATASLGMPLASLERHSARFPVPA